MAHCPVFVIFFDDAIAAQEEVVLAYLAAISEIFEICPASMTLLHEGGRLRVVQVVQHHHRGVLRATQQVKLVVILLAQLQKGLPGVEVLTVHPFVDIRRCRRDAFDLVTLELRAAPRNPLQSLVPLRLGLLHLIIVALATHRPGLLSRGLRRDGRAPILERQLLLFSGSWCGLER